METGSGVELPVHFLCAGLLHAKALPAAEGQLCLGPPIVRSRRHRRAPSRPPHTCETDAAELFRLKTSTLKSPNRLSPVTPRHSWSQYASGNLGVGAGTNRVSRLRLHQDHPTTPGVFFGTDNITLRLELNPAGTELNGSFESQVNDPAGNIVFTASGDYHATPIRAIP